MIPTLTWIYAIVFGVIGLLGFVPSFAPDGYLLGIFEVDSLHNVIHLGSGIIAAIAAAAGTYYASLYMRTFGVIYAIVALVGFVQGDTVVGMFGVNGADNVLHLVIAAVALYVGFVMNPGKRHERMIPGHA